MFHGRRLHRGRAGIGPRYQTLIGKINSGNWGTSSASAPATRAHSPFLGNVGAPALPPMHVGSAATTRSPTHRSAAPLGSYLGGVRQRVGASVAGGASSVLNSALCWLIIIGIILVSAAVVLTVVLVAIPAPTPPASNSTNVTSSAAAATDGGGTGLGTTVGTASLGAERSAPCTDFYAHVCHADGERSAFASLRKRTRGLRTQFLASTPSYQACVREGGLAEAVPSTLPPAAVPPVPSVPGVTDWQTFMVAQWATGGSFPLSLRVEKAVDRPEYVLVLEVDFTLARYLYEEFPEVYTALYPEELVSRIWETQISQSIEVYTHQYRTWAELGDSQDPEALPPTLLGLIGHVLGDLLSPDSLVHCQVDATHLAWYEHMLTACTTLLGKDEGDGDGEGTCQLIKDALTRATHDLQPGIGSYVAQAGYHPVQAWENVEVQMPAQGQATPGTLRWLQGLQRGHMHAARVTPLSARLVDDSPDEGAAVELTDQCELVAALLHHEGLNEYVATQLYTAAQLKVIEDEVLSITNHVRSSLARMVHGTSWLQSTTRDAALSKLEDLQIYILTQERTRAGASTGEEAENAGTGAQGAHWVHLLAEARQTAAQANRDLLRRDFGRYRHEYEPFRAALMGQTDVDVVNAWYDPTENTITIPVGILQSPFYHPPPESAESAEEERTRYWANLASIGMVLGHEMGHALDVNGRYFDYAGSWQRAGWWSAYDQQRTGGFDARMQCLAEDWGHPCGRADYGMHTMGEDMADQLGLRAAYRLQEFGHTGDMQRFYETYATLWCAKQTVAQECEQVASDVHALPRHRVNKSLRQLASFAAAYECVPGDPMVNEDECLVY